MEHPTPMRERASGRPRSAARLAICCALLAGTLAHAGMSSANAAGVPGQRIAQTNAGPDTRPNIVVFISDDMGWGQAGFNGGTDIATANLDRIADEGVRLTQFYAQPTCAPTRASLFTGRYAWKTGAAENPDHRTDDGLLLDERTLAEALHDSGYATWLVGKWHLGHWGSERLPLQRGFDHHYGFYNGFIDSYELFRPWRTWHEIFDWHRNGRPVVESGYSTFLLAEEASQLIERHNGSRPFFLYVGFNAPHDPYQAPPEYIQQVSPSGFSDEERKQRAMVKAMDDAIGQVMDALDRKGVLDETLVVFLNDNGGPSEAGGNLPYRELKRSYFEGGIRVPAVMRWPGRITAGSVSDSLMHVSDLFPTFAGLAGADTDRGLPLDGFDVWEAIANGAESPREELVHSLQVIRVGDWKLLEEDGAFAKGNKSSPQQLYNIAEDPYETTNLASSETAKVAELGERLTYHRPFARDAQPGEPIPGLDERLSPDDRPVMFGKEENTAYGAEIETALTQRDAGNLGPELLWIEASGDQVKIVYDETLDADSVPPADAFKVVVNPGYTSSEVTDVEVGESEVLLTLAQSVRSGETAGLTYEVPKTGAIRDVDGIAAGGVTWVTSLAEVSITAASSPVTEGTVAVFNVSLSTRGSAARTPESSAVSEVLTVAVRVTESGSMLSGTPPASVAFSQGDTSVTLRVPTAADSVVEADSAVTAAVATGTGYTVGTVSSATVTVEDDDAVTVTAGGSSGGGSGGGGGGGSGGSRNRPPVVTESIESQVLELGGSVRIDAAEHFRDPDNRTMTFEAESADVSVATVEVDGSVVTIEGIAHGVTTVSVTAVDNRRLRVSQSFEVSVGYQVSFASADVSVLEGSTAMLRVALNRPRDVATTVRYVLGADADPATADADAADHEGMDGEVTIAPGATEAGIGIAIRDDTDIEPPRESFTVTLQATEAQLQDFGLGIATVRVTIDEGVCDRTRQVRNALRRSLPCEAVSETDLAARTELDLAIRDVTALQGGDLSGLSGLTVLDLSGNALGSLPEGMFDGLGLLGEVQLQDNPGAPFTLQLELVRTDDALSSAGPASVVARVREGAPFAMRAALSAVNGTLSPITALIPAGMIAGTRIRVTQAAAGATRVTAAAPAMPDTRCGVLGIYPCYQGIATTAGGTLVLFKAPPEVTDTPARTTLAAEGDATRIDLSALFAASDEGALTYFAGSSDPTLVTATVDGTTLTLASNEDGREGAVTITVTATDEDGLSVTLTFEVTIEAMPRGLLRGWRRVLLEQAMERSAAEVE